MNAEVYLFGKSTQDQYFQYPQDYTQSVFQSFQQNTKGKHNSSFGELVMI